MPLLHALKTWEEPFEFVLSRKGLLATGSQGMDGFIAEAFASALGALAVRGIFFDVGDDARIENALPIACGIKAAMGTIQISG